MGLIGRWLSDAISLALALVCGVAAMQVPALTHAYAAALLQVADDARRDIDQREAAARAFYHLTADTDAGVVAALEPVEPANAQGLATSLARVQTLRAAYDRISAAPPLLQPLTAVMATVADPQGYKRAVLKTSFATFVPQIVISSASAIYGLVGLVFGSFVAQLLLSLLDGLTYFAGARGRPAR